MPVNTHKPMVTRGLTVLKQVRLLSHASPSYRSRHTFGMSSTDIYAIGKKAAAIAAVDELVMVGFGGFGTDSAPLQNALADSSSQYRPSERFMITSVLPALSPVMGWYQPRGITWLQPSVVNITYNTVSVTIKCCR